MWNINNLKHSQVVELCIDLVIKTFFNTDIIKTKNKIFNNKSKTITYTEVSIKI